MRNLVATLVLSLCLATAVAVVSTPAEACCGTITGTDTWHCCYAHYPNDPTPDCGVSSGCYDYHYWSGDIIGSGNEGLNENFTACYHSFGGTGYCTYTAPYAYFYRGKCLNNVISHSMYQKGIDDANAKKTAMLAEFNKLWKLGKDGTVRPDPPVVAEHNKSTVEMVVLCSGGGYVPKGLNVERG